MPANGRISQDPRMPRVGYLVADRYQVTEVLGEGGFAAVYLARDVRAGGQVAIKVLDPEQSDDPTAVDRFRQEVAVVRELSHHNTVKIWDVGTTDKGLIFYVMELVKGEELSKLIQREGPLSTERAVRILSQVLASLAEAHARGIVHRDLKPKNIMVVQTPVEPDYVKVLDFGIAKALAPELSMAKTQTGTLLATPAYAAPELLRASGIQPATDLYAAGLILIELLTGRQAVQGDSLADLIAKQMMPSPVALPPELEHHPLRPVIERATAKDIASRYQSAEIMLHDLRAYSGGGAPAGTSRTRPVGAPARGSRTTLMLGTLLIVIALIGGAVVFALWSKRGGGEAGGSGTAVAAGLGTGRSPGDSSSPVAVLGGPNEADVGGGPGPQPFLEQPPGPDLGQPLGAPDTGPYGTPIGPLGQPDLGTPLGTPLQADNPLQPPTQAGVLVRVAAGSFAMGSPRVEPFHQNDEPLRSVTLSHDFYIGRYEVTQAEFQALAGRNPSAHVNCGADCPVDSVSWYDAIAFANRRSQAEGLAACYAWQSESGTFAGGCQNTSAYGGWGCDGDYVLNGLTFLGLDCAGYRVPTEAEWEYAARAGTQEATYAGNPTRQDPGVDPVLAGIAWYMETSGNEPHPVGRLLPNPWGLYDVYGNVWEWTNDWYAPYPPGAAWDPTGPAWGVHPVIRGGGYNGTPRTIRAANRYDDVEGVPPTYRGIDTGFRLARTALQ